MIKSWRHFLTTLIVLLQGLVGFVLLDAAAAQGNELGWTVGREYKLPVERGGVIVLDVLQLDDNYFAISLITSKPGSCFGSATGLGSVSGRTLTVKNMLLRDEVDCTVQVEFDEDASRATVSTSDGCVDLHGTTCGFDGTLSLTDPF